MTRLLPKTFKFRTIFESIVLLILLCLLCIWLYVYPHEIYPAEYASLSLVAPLILLEIYKYLYIWKKYQKEAVPFSEIPVQTYNDFEAIKVLSSPLQKIVCPYCNNVFKLPILIQPFKVIPSKAICPKCGEKSLLVWDSFKGFQIRRKQQYFGVAVESTVKPINTMVDVCCPHCNNTFRIPQQNKPFRVKCPKCNRESELR